MLTKALTALFVILAVICIVGGATYLQSDPQVPQASVAPAEIRVSKSDALSPVAGGEPAKARVEPATSVQSQVSKAALLGSISPFEKPDAAPFPTRQPGSVISDFASEDAPPAQDETAPEVSPVQIPTRSHRPAPTSFPGASQFNFAGAPATRELPLPVVFQDLEGESGLDAAQSAVVKSLREDFVRDIGGPNQNAYDPGYIGKWNDKQPVYDDQALLFFGPEYVNKRALRAAWDAAEKQGL